jgi:hypothetical protein
MAHLSNIRLFGGMIDGKYYGGHARSLSSYRTHYAQRFRAEEQEAPGGVG